MGIVRPTGGHADLMLAAGGWPDVDENSMYDRALEYTRVLRQVTEVLETCRHQQNEIFDGGVWSGGAASAASSELGTEIDELLTLQTGLATVITWQQYVGSSIVQAKSNISDNVEAAQTQIHALEIDPHLDAAERAAAIDTVIGAARGANLGVVAGAAEQILASKSWRPADSALKDLLDQKTPPPLVLPETRPVITPPPTTTPSPVITPPVQSEPEPTPSQPEPVGPGPIMPSVPVQPSPGTPATVVPQPVPGMPPSPVSPIPGAGGSAPAVPGGGPAVAPSPSAPGVPLGPAAPAEPPGSGGRGKGMVPASASGAPPTTAPRAEDSSAAPAGPGMSGVPMSPGGGAGAGSGSSRGSRAPVGQKQSDASPSTRPAAARGRAPAKAVAARGEPVAPPTPSDDGDVAETIAVEPTIPVSSARAERDAIAEAATADAARRRGTDPLVRARRIAAALNAPGAGGAEDFGFFWVTAVTTEGVIVVANSYGLGYIPDPVQLPESVYMATADETIPAPERARWATYPVAAVQGWAQHRDTKLRAVIATDEQFAGFDPGVTKVALLPDDIPNSGAMVGRSRLAVVAPESADRLADTADVRLVELLPAAPASTGADALSEPSASAADRRPLLWLDVMSPMFSSAAGRDTAHLRAFRLYAAHAAEVLLAEAHAAAEPGAQRCAVTDWLYWNHLTELLDAALTPAG